MKIPFKLFYAICAYRVCLKRNHASLQLASQKGKNNNDVGQQCQLPESLASLGIIGHPHEAHRTSQHYVGIEGIDRGALNRASIMPRGDSHNVSFSSLAGEVNIR